MKNASPAAALIITSRNRPGLLLDAVQAALAGDAPPAEVVIVDQSDVRNADVDALARRSPATIRYLWTPARGASRGRNTGIRAATQPILLFTDDDCLVEASWADTITRALTAAGERTAITGRVVAGTDETAGAFTPSTISDQSSVDYAGRIHQDVLFSNNMALFRRAFDEVGLFDERLGPGARFSNAEDNDLGFRLLEAGYRIRYVPEAVVKHRGWRGRAEYLPLRWAYGRGQGAYLMKHTGSADRYMRDRLFASIWDHLRRLRRVRREPLVAAGNLVYVIAMITGAAEWRLTQPRTSSAGPVTNTAVTRP